MIKDQKTLLLFITGFVIVLLKNIFLGEENIFLKNLSILVDMVVFWGLIGPSRLKPLSILLSVAAFCTPLFLKNPLFNFDPDNQILKSCTVFLSFLIIIFYNKTGKRIIIPLYMLAFSIFDVSIAQGFTANISILNTAGNLFLQWPLTLTLVLSIAKTLTLFCAIIIFYELNNQFFTWTSWTFSVELKSKKNTLIIVFLLFKTLIIWSISTLILAFFGQNLLPVFYNKLSIVFAIFSSFGLLLLHGIYFRKYVSIYFYENIGIKNYLYIMLGLPFVDVVAILILIMFKNYKLKSLFKFSFSDTVLKILIITSLVVYIVYMYFTLVQNLPTANFSLSITCMALFIIFPMAITAGLLLIKNVMTYRYFIALIITAGFLIYLFCIPTLGTNVNLQIQLTFWVLYSQLAFFIFWLYPFFYLKHFLKIND